MVRCGDVHLLLHHVVNVGGGAALDPFLLLSLQFVGHHLNGLCPLISKVRVYKKVKLAFAALLATLIHRLPTILSQALGSTYYV